MEHVLAENRERIARGEDVSYWARMMLGFEDRADEHWDEIPEGPGELEALHERLEAAGVRSIVCEAETFDGPVSGMADALRAAGRRLDRRIDTRERRRRTSLRPRLVVRRRGGCAGRPRARARRSGARASRAGPDGSSDGLGDDEPAPPARRGSEASGGAGRAHAEASA
jgi:hypothetical protein